MKIRLLSIIALLLGTATQLFAHDFEAANSDGVTIYYNITDAVKKTVCVTYKGNDKYSAAYIAASINVPSSVEYEGQTYSVTAIGDFAFYGCFLSSESEVSLPSTIEAINLKAFSTCWSLKSISFTGTALKTIGNYAFSECYMASITIPNSVNEIGEYAFKNCNALTDVTLPSALKDISPYAFLECTCLENVVIQGNVETIGKNAFEDCKNLKTKIKDLERDNIILLERK